MTEERAPPLMPMVDIEAVVREVAELPDRTTPIDLYNDYMIVTGNELRSILRAHAIDVSRERALTNADWSTIENGTEIPLKNHSDLPVKTYVLACWDTGDWINQPPFLSVDEVGNVVVREGMTLETAIREAAFAMAPPGAALAWRAMG